MRYPGNGPWGVQCRSCHDARLVGRICAFLLTVGVLLMALAQVGAASTFDVKKIEASVYKIYTMRKKGIGTGTGFLVNGRRILVTNFHVVAEGEKYFIGYRDGRDGKLVEARVLERRGNIDLAVMEAYEDLPGRALPLGDFEPEKLTNVIAVGFPGAADVKQDTAARTLPELYARMKEPSGFNSTLTPGMVSRIYSASNTALSETQVINARTVQHNAPINPGNSGGPLFDECGTVVGVNSFSPKGAQGLFFSIHSGEVIRFLRELNIAYAAVGHACLAASLSSGGGLVLPLIIGMAATLAVVAVVFAWRGGAAVGAVGQYMSRRLTGKGQRAERPAGRDAARASPGDTINLAQTAAALSLQPAKGGKGHALEVGRTAVVGRGKQCEITIEDDTVSSAHARLEVNAQGQRVTITDLQFLQRHLPQRQPHHEWAGAGGRRAAVRQRRVQADGGSPRSRAQCRPRRGPQSRLDAVGLRSLRARAAVRAAAAGAERPCRRAGDVDRSAATATAPSSSSTTTACRAHTPRSSTTRGRG